jgi:hypothetical protein
MILHKEQVDLMTAEQCQKHLKLLDKRFPMDKYLGLLSPEQFEQVDGVANTMLYLEDRIRYIQASDNAINANKVRYGRE